VLLGNGNGTFQTAVPYRAGGFQATFVAVADLNGDGKRDLVVTSQCRDQNCTLHGAVSALLGNGDGTFKSPSPANYDSGGFNAYSVAVGDVNGDGKPDLLVNRICANASCKGVVAMLLGNGDGTFQPAVTRGSGGYFAHSVAITDVDSDGNPDVVVTNTCTVSIAKNCGHGAISVLLGYGNGIFQPAATFSTGGNGPFSAAVGDVDGNGKPDLLPANQSGPGTDGSVGVLLNETEPGVATTTTLQSSPNPSNYQQVVTFTAMVTSVSGTPPGTVVFYDGFKKEVGHALLANGSASISISSLSARPHVIRAAYTGAGNFALSVSGAVTQLVAPTKTTLTSNPNPSQFGQSVTFTAHITGTGGAPTGKVRFLDGTTGIGMAALTSGHATLSRSKLAVGTHSITAQYQGDDGNARSTSNVVNQVVH
jgi:hypothetical protein